MDPIRPLGAMNRHAVGATVLSGWTWIIARRQGVQTALLEARRHGWRRALYRVLLKAINTVALFKILRGVGSTRRLRLVCFQADTRRPARSPSAVQRRYYLSRGSRGLISYVESDNFDSLKSVFRMGYEVFGSVYVIKIFGRTLTYASPGCGKFGFRVSRAPRR